MNFNGSIADDADACDNHYGSDSSSSSESEGWLTRCNVSSDDDDCPPAEMATADVIDPIRLPPDERFSYMIQGVPGMQLTVQCSNATGIGHQLWPATFLMAAALEKRHRSSPGYWKGKTVLELGSGCGLVGLVAAALGAHVMLTDLPTVLDLLSSNVTANLPAILAAGGRAEVTALQWGKDAPPPGWGSPDLVLGADLVYHRELYPVLLDTLRQFGSATTILLANVRRWSHNEQQFFRPARKHFAIRDIIGEVDPLAVPALAGLASLSKLRLYEFHHLPLPARPALN
mmetsp:Transcript_3488/g.10125  ORF Transcript_3488/g.10125 Transcript_3488/m.10125 type:complete len:287 (+) Transcript_3488:151-1011(+)